MGSKKEEKNIYHVFFRESANTFFSRTVVYAFLLFVVGELKKRRGAICAGLTCVPKPLWAGLFSFGLLKAFFASVSLLSGFKGKEKTR